MRIPPLALLVICALCVFLGWKTNGWRLESQIHKAQAAQLTDTLTQERESTQAAHVADTGTSAAQQDQRQHARTITKEVIRYVQSPVAGQCTLPAEWVQIHDSAAGVPPDPAAPGQPAAAAGEAGSPVTDAQALGAVTSNYDTCLQEINRLQGWQAWYRSQFP